MQLVHSKTHHSYRSSTSGKEKLVGEFRKKPKTHNGHRKLRNSKTLFSCNFIESVGKFNTIIENDETWKKPKKIGESYYIIELLLHKGRMRIKANNTEISETLTVDVPEEKFKKFKGNIELLVDMLQIENHKLKILDLDKENLTSRNKANKGSKTVDFENENFHQN